LLERGQTWKSTPLPSIPLLCLIFLKHSYHLQTWYHFYTCSTLGYFFFFLTTCISLFGVITKKYLRQADFVKAFI
jgi:hypothetical protein